MNHEDISDLELSYWSDLPNLQRRDFLKTLGGGIAVFFILGNTNMLLSSQQRRGYPTDFNAYLLVREDGIINCYIGKIEMGQGIKTSIAQTAAEELNVSLDSIKMFLGDTEACPWDMGTFGSMTTRFFGPTFKAAAAEARMVLLELASEHLNVPKNKLLSENGVVFEKGRKNNSVTYAQLAKGKKIARQLSEKAVEKAITEFKVIGKPTGRTDAYEKATGQAIYAGDIRYPGMVYGRVLHPPVHRATLKSVDTTEAEMVEGVTIINQEGIVAALHANPEQAELALYKMKAEFNIPDETVNNENIHDHLLKNAPEGRINDERGNLKAGEKASTEVFEHTFKQEYVAHSPMETHTATAKYENGKMEIWISTQTPFGDKERIARELNMDSENVHVKTPYVGGGFGGKTGGLQSVEAAKLSKISGKPVQIFWTRQEEIFYDNFMPAAVVNFKSGIDDNGKINLWDYKVYFAGSRGSEQYYDVPHNAIAIHGEWMRSAPGTHPFGTGAWRAPAANTNIFARESQMDIMAAKAKIDPLEFRLKNTSDKKMIGVLKAAADKFGWTPGVGSTGRGYGIACGIDAGTYVAAIAEINVNKQTGEVKVERVACAQDMGLVINPEGATLQMEGCITMGLGYALTEEIQFQGGEIFDTNFDTYEIPRFSWIPEIETIILDSEDKAPHGGGEPAIVIMGGMIANGIFDATGARLFHQPMTSDRVKTAIDKM